MSLALLPETRLGSIFDDASEIIVDIQFGEGGDDSKIFVDELLCAYLKYSISVGLKSCLLHSSEGHSIIKFKGDGAGRAFKYETGLHCIQRIPPTESKGRRHTSYVVVAILPLPPTTSQDDIPLEELDINFVNLGGKGGQHQNRSESGVRITHIPTGLKVVINGRSQHSNKREAMRIISAKVNQMKNDKNISEYNDTRRELVGSGGRGNKIRTYNFMESRVVDHRTGKKTGNIKSVMKGKLNLLF